MINVTINGEKHEFMEGMTILEAVRSIGVHIPTLCYHEAVLPYGACRLCMVEISERGRKQLVASCLYPLSDGLEVNTDTDEVKEARRSIMEFLLARNPDSEYLLQRARELGVEKPRFVLDPEDQSDCINCGLCARVCSEIVGVGAIDFVDRGIKSEVKSPFYRASDVCIGCGTCAYVCPTGAIKIEEFSKPAIVHPWDSDFPKRCLICGGYHFLPDFPLNNEELCAQESTEKKID